MLTKKYTKMIEDVIASGATQIIIPTDPNGHWTEFKKELQEYLEDKQDEI